MPPGRRLADESLTRAVPGYVCPTLLARREAFRTVGEFDQALQHSTEMAWILAAAERGLALELLPEVWVKRRLHGANVSTLKAGDSQREYLRLLKTWLDRRRRGGGALTHDFGAFSAGPRPDGDGPGAGG